MISGLVQLERNVAVVLNALHIIDSHSVTFFLSHFNAGWSLSYYFPPLKPSAVSSLETDNQTDKSDIHKRDVNFSKDDGYALYSDHFFHSFTCSKMYRQKRED